MIDMGCLHLHNISEYLLVQLYNNWLDRKTQKYLKYPRLFFVEQAVNYFRKNIELLQKVFRIVEKSYIHPQEKKKALKLIQTFTEEKFGAMASDGCELDKDSLRRSIGECLAIWSSKGLLAQKDGGWYIKSLKGFDILKNIIDYSYL